jgi:hypothetical protein
MGEETIMTFITTLALLGSLMFWLKLMLDPRVEVDEKHVKAILAKFEAQEAARIAKIDAELTARLEALRARRDDRGI